MKSAGSKTIKHDSVAGYYGAVGSSKPPFNKAASLPKNMKKPFLKRLVEWLTA